jgi:glutathione synthase/RimK-type ligase-like ATP-grasp enzyme
MKKILVITAKTDIHCHFVALEIKKQGGDILRINTEDFATNSRFSTTNRNNYENWVFSVYLKDSEIRFDRDSFDTVWYRKPDPVVAHESFQEQAAKIFIEREYTSFLKAFYSLNSDKRWVNDYWKNRMASSKLLNLEIANHLGLQVPQTIVANDKSQIQEFCEYFNWNVIVKSFFTEGFRTSDGKYWMNFAKRVTASAFQQFADKIEYAPVLMQEYIEKDLELRVTVIGEQVFTAAIHSQECEKSSQDFRAMTPLEIKHTVFDLPEEIAKKLLLFNRHYGLAFSTFDLILTSKGDYYFLECNPNGQWYWIEALTQMPMAKTMAEFLLGNAG